MAGLIPLATETKNGLMPAGYAATKSKGSTGFRFVELFKIKKSENSYFDCFVGISKNHQNVFSLYTLHTYNIAIEKGLCSSKIIDINTNLTFYYKINQDNSLSVFLKTTNQYYFTFVIPISFFSSSFFEYVMTDLESLPEDAVLGNSK